MIHQPEILTEGLRLVARAEDAGLALRLFGGVAIRVRAGDRYPDALARAYADLDFITTSEGAAPVEAFVAREGYEPYIAFNRVHGHKRMLFFDNENDRHLDVFVAPFAMCHEIPIDGRLELERQTLPLAELLLTKLQIVQLNEKDVSDALALLVAHEVAEHDGDAVNAARIAEVCASDWGLWRTITGNLAVCLAHLERFDLTPGQRADAARRLETLLERIEEEPKSRSWRLRSRIGERMRWYELPEEVEDGV